MRLILPPADTAWRNWIVLVFVMNGFQTFFLALNAVVAGCRLLLELGA